MSVNYWLKHWHGPAGSVRFSPADIYGILSAVDQPCYVVRVDGRVGVTDAGSPAQSGGHALLGVASALRPAQLGSQEFMRAHGLRMNYMAGAMANGIASENMVIALGRRGLLGSFGAAGLLPERLEEALARLTRELPDASFAVNLIHSPMEDALERRAVELFLRYSLRLVEASAYMGLTPHVVRYRLAGLELDPSQRIVAKNRLIAKVSRSEVAEHFLSPAPAALVKQLLDQGLITATQARLAAHVPMADDITVEGDSGGHTDRRPLIVMLQAIRGIVDTLRERHGYAQRVRVGAAGGIGTPLAVCAAFGSGADYIVTGSINQATLEAGTSSAVKELLAQAGVADCEMAPAADMFEMGVDVQVLKKGVLFPMRAKKLYALYKGYDSLDAIPADEREKLERHVLRSSVDQIWRDVQAYFVKRDPVQLERAEANPKRKMALVFRWYLGMSSRWAKVGDAPRAMDYQIWCGPAMGAFNEWVKDSPLAPAGARRVADVATHLMRGAAYHTRVQQLKQQGISLPASATWYRPGAAPAASELVLHPAV